jgi:hypothetical protein
MSYSSLIHALTTTRAVLPLAEDIERRITGEDNKTVRLQTHFGYRNGRFRLSQLEPGGSIPYQ